MRLEFFNAADGDSFLFTSDGKNLLVDGGRKSAFLDNVLPALDAVRQRGETLDIVCVSHIDADHITGIVALFDLMLEWQVYDYHHNVINDKDYPEPSPWRPPQVGHVWHNGFQEQVDLAVDPATRLLQSQALILAASASDHIRNEADASGELATSIAQALGLGQRLGAQQLRIPINPEFNGDRMTMPSPVPLTIGTAALKLIGPSAGQIKALRDEWEKWVANNQAKVDELNRESQRDADRLGLETADVFFALRAERSDSLASRANVTVPNLASIMLFAEEGDHTAILTGDGFGSDIIEALRAEGDLGAAGLHVDVFKVPHHGSEHNSDHTLYEEITADHYVIPSDGSHENPDLRVIEDIIKSRVGRRSGQTRTAHVNEPFSIWITADPDAHDDDDTKHLRKVRSLIRRWQRRYQQNINYEFLSDDSFVFDLD